MRFSVIVPVYKVEAYLPKCVESVLSQKCQDYELILVDDGSPDNCPHICEEYAKRCLNVKVIHKINGGLSSARNAGLDIAEGEYIIFLDSDDYWCDENLLSDLSDRICKLNEDVILFGVKVLKKNGKEKQTSGFYDLEIVDRHEKADTLNYLYSANQFPGSSCVICVNRSLIENFHLRFKLGVTAEDLEWVLSVLVCSQSIGAINGVQYVYVRREGSITSSSRLSGVQGTANAIEYYCKFGYSNPGMSRFVSRIFLLSVMSYNQLPEKDRKEAGRLLDRNVNVLKESGQGLYYIFVKVFGYRISSFAIRTIYNIIR